VSGDVAVPPAERLARARAMLAGAGFPAARVEALDPEGSTAAISAPASERARLLGPDGVEVARRVAALGFRYVALDLDAPG
jgi:hypothetical protein